MKSEDRVISFSTRARRLWYEINLELLFVHLLICVTIQLDAGQHAGYEGLASLPFYDDFDLSTVDILLISQ